MQKRLLVVDDERVILFAIRRYFERRGFIVDCAREREEAEALLASEHYDAVIADLRLTGIHGAEGLEVLSFIRSRCMDACVVILTAHGTPELEEHAHALGVNRFLRKPQPLEALARVFGCGEEAQP